MVPFSVSEPMCDYIVPLPWRLEVLGSGSRCLLPDEMQPVTHSHVE